MAEEDLPPEQEDAGYVTVPAEEIAPEPESTPEPAPAPTLEDVAARMGWAPEDQWRGDPDKWKPADQFVSDTADINSKLGSKLNRLERQMDAMVRTSTAVTEQALARQRQELLDQRQEAFETGDSDKFNRADKALTELQQPAQQPHVPPETQEFMERNSSWFQKDGAATQWAINRAEELKALPPAKQLAQVEKEAREYFPEHFPQASKPKPAPLTKPGARAAPKPAAKSFAALPPEAQKAALEFEKGGKCSKEEYAAIYFDEQGV
jgi:hypothetical protein